jgi:hypothetical protein
MFVFQSKSAGLPYRFLAAVETTAGLSLPEGAQEKCVRLASAEAHYECGHKQAR